MSETDNQDLKEKNLKEWLANLQRESWQLELIVSGFSIFLLLEGTEFLSDLFQHIRNNPSSDLFGNLISKLIVVFCLFSFKAMTVNLLVHLFLRGLWIGMIGLQSVTKNIDYDKLNYDKIYEDFLKPKYHNLESGIVLIDKIASLIFSLSFLLIFCFLSFLLFLLFVGGVEYIIGFIFSGLPGYYIIENIFSYSSLFIGIIYAFDFLSGGSIKRIRGVFAQIYFPIYRFLGWITLSFLYRSLYYSLVSNINKAVLMIFLISYFLLMTTISSIRISSQPYHLMDASPESIHSNFYDAERKDGESVEKASIPSKIYSGKHLPLFIRNWSTDTEIIRLICPNLKTTKKEGLHFGRNIPKTWKFNRLFSNEQNFIFKKEKIDSALLCNKMLFDIYLNDQLLTDQEFHFTKHPSNDDLGFHTMIDINDLPSGENLIRIEKLGLKNTPISDLVMIEYTDSIATKLEKIEYAYLYFWK